MAGADVPESARDSIRVALAGFGLAGRAFHAPFIATTPGLRLTHVLQRRATNAAAIDPAVQIVRDFDALLAPEAGIDLVVIATPNDTHAPLATRALEAGRHVVVDKPFALTSAECRRVAGLARERGLVLSVYHNRRWDGDFLTVRSLLRLGWLGPLQRFESRFDRHRPEVRAESWREQAVPGSGLTYDLAPHLLDQAFVLFGKPAALGARIAAERPAAVADDHFEITLRYESFEARLGATLLAEHPGPRFRVQGTLGEYERLGSDPQESRLRAGARPDEPRWGEDPQECWGAIRATVDGRVVEEKVPTLPGDYGAFYRNIRDAISGRAPLTVRPEEATETIRALEVAFESSRQGGGLLEF
jgi:scyllo-inositol 2-dehydrogenase (NADP+)